MASFKWFVWTAILQLLVGDVQCVRTFQPSHTDQPRVVGGVIPPEDEMYKKRPWITHLRKRARDHAFSRCTGAFISRNAIITAVHCITRFDEANALMAERGKDNPYVEFTVMGKAKYDNMSYKLNYKRDVVIPEEINCKTMKSELKFDVAILRLDHIGGLPKDLDGFWPVPLAGFDVQPIPGDSATVMGFGMYDKNEKLVENYSQSVPYRTVPIKIAPEKAHRSWCPPYLFVSEPPEKDQRRGLCGGDSGGPLECYYSNGEPYLCGVNKFVTNKEKSKIEECLETASGFVNATTEKFRNFICPYLDGNSVVGKNKTFCINYTAVNTPAVSSPVVNSPAVSPHVVNSPAVNYTAKSDTALYYSALRSAMYIAFGIWITNFM